MLISLHFSTRYLTSSNCTCPTADRFLNHPHTCGRMLFLQGLAHIVHSPVPSDLCPNYPNSQMRGDYLCRYGTVMLNTLNLTQTQVPYRHI